MRRPLARTDQGLAENVEQAGVHRGFRLDFEFSPALLVCVHSSSISSTACPAPSGAASRAEEETREAVLSRETPDQSE
jgi:hypothetical protein